LTGGKWEKNVAINGAATARNGARRQFAAVFRYCNISNARRQEKGSAKTDFARFDADFAGWRIEVNAEKQPPTFRSFFGKKEKSGSRRKKRRDALNVAASCA
jgi:hypothetical protein